MTTTDESVRELLGAVLGLLDGVPDEGLAKLQRRKIKTSTTRFHARDVYKLLDAVETVRPGLLDHYFQIRADSARDKKTGTPR